MLKFPKLVCLVVGLGACYGVPRTHAQDSDARRMGRDLQERVDDLLGRGPVESRDFGYSGLIQCILTDLEVEKKDRWHPATAPGFSVAPGEIVELKVRRLYGKGKGKIYAEWDVKDDTLKLCKRAGGRACNGSRVDGRRFARGIRMQFHLPGDARGVAQCQYAR